MTTCENRLVKNTCKPWLTSALNKPFYALFQAYIQKNWSSLNSSINIKSPLYKGFFYMLILAVSTKWVHKLLNELSGTDNSRVEIHVNFNKKTKTVIIFVINFRLTSNRIPKCFYMHYTAFCIHNHLLIYISIGK